MLNPCWSNSKRFLSVLVVLESLLFLQNVKNFKNSVALFWRLSRRLVQSHVPGAGPHREFSRLTDRSMPQSRKILRIFFKIWVFNAFRDSVWRLVRGWKVQSRGDSEIFAAYLATPSRVELSVAKKHFDKFFKIFVLSVMATGPIDLLATWLSHENHVFCRNRSVFKCFQFFPRTSVTVHCLPYLKHSQTHRVTLEQTSIFTSFQLKIFKKKVWFFSFSLHTSCSESCLLESVSCWFHLGYLLFWWWVGWMLVVLGFLGIVD